MTKFNQEITVSIVDYFQNANKTGVDTYLKLLIVRHQSKLDTQVYLVNENLVSKKVQ